MPLDLLMMLWYFILLPMEIIFKHISSVSNLNIAVLQLKVRKSGSKRLKNNSFYLNLTKGQNVNCGIASLINQWLN